MHYSPRRAPRKVQPSWVEAEPPGRNTAESEAKDMEAMRFGILKAREAISPERLTPSQLAFLEDRRDWVVGDHGSDRAYKVYCHRALKCLGPLGRMGLSDEEWERYVKSFR